MIPLPGISAPVACKIIIISGAVVLIGASFSDHLHLASAGAVEIGGLVGDTDGELLDGFHRRGHDPGGHVRPADTHVAGGGCVAMIPGLVVSVDSAIELKRGLVRGHSPNFA